MLQNVARRGGQKNSERVAQNIQQTASVLTVLVDFC